MAPFRESIKRIAENMQSCEEWLELVRDLNAPILDLTPPKDLNLRWADKSDLLAINALEGFVKETEFMEASLKKGDRCLVLEKEERILAFAWVTFHNFRLALWYTLNVPSDGCYLVYIFVHPEIGGQGIGSFLLGALMSALHDQGITRIFSGMYSN
jgi:GNAT superfamily N-acetyltransferase